MIGADILRAAVQLGIGVLALTGSLEIWMLVVLVLVHGIGEAFFGPRLQRAGPGHPLADADPAGQRDRADRAPGGAQLRSARRSAACIVAVVGPGTSFVIDAARSSFSACLHPRDPRRGRPACASAPRAMVVGAARGHRLRAHPDLAVGHAARGVAGDPVLHGPDPGARCPTSSRTGCTRARAATARSSRSRAPARSRCRCGSARAGCRAARSAG